MNQSIDELRALLEHERAARVEAEPRERFELRGELGEFRGRGDYRLQRVQG